MTMKLLVLPLFLTGALSMPGSADSPVTEYLTNRRVATGRPLLADRKVTPARAPLRLRSALTWPTGTASFQLAAVRRRRGSATSYNIVRR